MLREHTRKKDYHGKKKKEVSSDLEQPQQELVVDPHVIVQEESSSNDVVPPALPFPPIPPLKTVSESKIIDIDLDKVLDDDAEIPSLISGYRLMDMSILADVFASLSCPGCHDTKTLKLRDIFEKKRGLARSRA